uniref:NADH-ubiquinone oxidoreductase chain 2 n=1 Tax=Brentidae sp. GENSP01 TaxID=1205806 RepID=A0A0S2MQQ8_9CUCU|nr:NADH deshydrogenase subunit 2 [Brentidae sp. GENSP01]
MKFHKIIFFNSLIFGTFLTISSYSWLSMWMGLEINLLSIIPLMKNHKNTYPSEAAFKYFITQALASNIFLFSIIINFHLNQFFLTPQIQNFSLLILNISLLLKLGAAPLHFWFPEVMYGLNWNNSLIMLTWQKIAPMILIMYNLNFPMFFSIMALISSLVGGLSGLNQTDLRKIMAYSSINHIGWMISGILISQSVWMIYFITYSALTLNLYFIFNQMKIFNLMILFTKMNNNKILKFIFIMNFFSLSGLPPFLGFYPKWLVINNLMVFNFYWLSLFLVIFTLLSMFMYMRICFSSILISFSEPIFFTKKKMSFKIFNFNLITLSSLLLCLMIFNFF